MTTFKNVYCIEKNLFTQQICHKTKLTTLFGFAVCHELLVYVGCQSGSFALSLTVSLAKSPESKHE